MWIKLIISKEKQMDYNFAYLPFVLGLLVVAWFVLAEFLKGESVQETYI